jgi:hypothetical protein
LIDDESRARTQENNLIDVNDQRFSANLSNFPSLVDSGQQRIRIIRSSKLVYIEYFISKRKKSNEKKIFLLN